MTVHMLSGRDWPFSLGDLVLAPGLLLLFVEIVKSTRTGVSSVIDHGLSLVLFVVCLLEFIALSGFATSIFFLLTLMTALGVIAGFTISIVVAKRDPGIARGIMGTS